MRPVSDGVCTTKIRHDARLAEAVAVVAATDGPVAVIDADGSTCGVIDRECVLRALTPA